MPKSKKSQKASSAANQPRQLPPKDPILSSGPPKDLEDFKIKNARAKELIMSTLEPGSEPWKIAEPLELASDIWKALEAKYAPKPGEKSKSPPKAHQVSDQSPEIDTGLDTKEEQPKQSSSPPEPPIDSDTAIKNRKEANARATKALRETMPNRDQRFLWAVLHGGKPETEAWFNGTSLPT